MKIVAVFAVLLLAATCHARVLKQTETRYATVAEALQAAGGSRVSTLIAAVQAAELSIPDDATWTIFAPTNEAFSDDDIKETTGLTAAQLLEPANKQALTNLLSYHVIPSGALRAAQLTDGQQLTTALAGAAPLRVDIDDDGVEIEVSDGGDDGDDADVVTADILAGNSVIHIIDEVLIPSSLRSARAGRRLLDDDNDDGNDDDGNDDGDDDGDDNDDDNDDKDDGDDDNDDDKKKKL